MTGAEKRHYRECGELKRDLDGCAEELIVRVLKSTPPDKQEAFDVWAHALRQACNHPGNDQAREYAFAAMRELIVLTGVREARPLEKIR